MAGVASLWREKFAKYRLVGSKCKGCGRLHFPASSYCGCGGVEMDDFAFSGRGTVHTFSTVRVAGAGFAREAPFTVAVVELEEGPRLTAQIVDADPARLRIGDKVSLCFRKIVEDGKTGIIYYGYKFRPENG